MIAEKAISLNIHFSDLFAAELEICNYHFHLRRWKLFKNII